MLFVCIVIFLSVFVVFSSFCSCFLSCPKSPPLHLFTIPDITNTVHLKNMNEYERVNLEIYNHLLTGKDKMTRAKESPETGLKTLVCFLLLPVNPLWSSHLLHIIRAVFFAVL